MLQIKQQTLAAKRKSETHVKVFIRLISRATVRINLVYKAAKTLAYGKITPE